MEEKSGLDASGAQLLKFLNGTEQFEIPIYQRMYSWEEKQCRQLWEDILFCGANDKIDTHFTGSIVYIESKSGTISNKFPFFIIDGQQRLTTIILILHVLTEELEKKYSEKEKIINNYSIQDIRNCYILDSKEKSDKKYKLLLSENDKIIFKSIIDGEEISNNEKSLIFKNYNFFKKWIVDSHDNLEAILNGIAKLYIVDIKLDKDKSRPQVIFENMNAKIKPLSKADLIRNFILMNLDSDDQENLYNKFWRPMEKKFGQEYNKHFDIFIRHYLTFKTGEIVKEKHVYDEFKHYKENMKEDSVEDLVKEIKRNSKYYCHMALGQEPDSDLNLSFGYLFKLSTVAYPFLLELYNLYDKNSLNKKDFLEALDLIEAYIFCRAVCAMTTNSLTATFANFGKDLKKYDANNYLESIKIHFLLMPSYRQFPNKKTFENEFKSRDLFNFKHKDYWLRKLENHERIKDAISFEAYKGKYTAEHIMPQNPKLPNGWEKELGDNWKGIHEKYLHTLGNLTLTEYNPEYSDKSFYEKCTIQNGFENSTLYLNKKLCDVEKWNEQAIIKRADKLAEKALKVWEFPNLPDDVLEQYKEKQKGVNEYSVTDHPYIDVGGYMHEVFEAFRKEVIELDPCISEEFLKLYVAYKAETNFVDVTPQKAQLRLSLNMPFPKINDAKAKCKDITNLGRWGNGDVEVGLGNISDLPYIMGLVRQALEWQLENSDDSEI